MRRLAGYVENKASPNAITRPVKLKLERWYKWYLKAYAFKLPLYVNEVINLAAVLCVARFFYACRTQFAYYIKKG